MTPLPFALAVGAIVAVRLSAGTAATCTLLAPDWPR